MKKDFTAKDFDTVYFMTSGHENHELLKAKEYLKEIQMSFNIGDVNDSLDNFTDEKTLFEIYKESVFSANSLAFLEQIKYMTSSDGLNTTFVEKASFNGNEQDNYIFLERNLINHAKEFITAIWDCCLLLKMAHAKKEHSYLMDAFNRLFAQLTKEKTGDETHYKKHEDALDMICELVLFMQTYMSDFLIFAIKAKVSFSSKKKLEMANKKFAKTVLKSTKIAYRHQLFEQIRSKNYQLLLKLLIDQKNNELRLSAQ
ncbi:hypothetical protein [Candidatus Marinarcus aquaticus]|uniref:Uncharacterized protein n=1 Tax=Candidatus Marinarcus aquaticus TaxID=2044504 RepID=A0A4Q0XV08_9BACT|nr:hypothetical protein [Candidatus Marinarcus aquaticus]RXJ60805.1 hypothetical protein CRV04_01975 [Candidatus Marinarcus aquaticus]